MKYCVGCVYLYEILYVKNIVYCLEHNMAMIHRLPVNDTFNATPS